MTASEAIAPEETPFDRIGGRSTVDRLVARFYDLMEFDPAYAELRGLHDRDLGPMRESLAGFLTGWLGGPRDWFEAHPGKCMMSMHATVPVDLKTARQWVHAMARAIEAAEVESGLAAQMNQAFARMAANMASRG